MLPLFATFFGVQALVPELLERFTSLVALRMSATRYLLARLLAAGSVSFALFFAYAAIDYFVLLWAFPAFDSKGAALPPQSAFVDAYDFWAPLFHSSAEWFGVVYASWFGLHAAVWAMLAFALVLLLKNLYIALVAPVGIFLGLWLWFYEAQLYKLSPLSLWVVFVVPDMNFVVDTMVTLSALALVIALALFAIFRRKSLGVD